MRRATRTAMAVSMCVVLMGAGMALAAQGASATPTPIYNAPAGGGAVQTVEVKFGPFNLDPQGTGHDQDESQGLVPRPAGSFGIKTAAFDLVDEQGQPIGKHDVHLHHFVIGAVGQVDTACPNRMAVGNIPARPLIGSGMERTPIAFPDPYVLKVNAGDEWGAVWHLMNMTNTPKTFYVKYTLGIQMGADKSNSRLVTPFWADSRTCPAGTTWNVPGNGGPGSVETLSKTWPMPFDGYIVGVGGHVHDGGLSIVTRHEDGSLICENDATYAGGMLDKIAGCPVHDSVKKDEMISVESNYDNSFPHQDVMGIAVLYLWEGSQGIPPTTTTTSTAPQNTTTTMPGAADPAADLTATPEVLGTSTAAAVVVATPAFAG